MKSIIRLKDEARRLEQREDWEGAAAVYLAILKAAEDAGGDVDLPLYNRVGDLCIRLGRGGDAVQYYEQAADRYAEAGFYNNAIALCNKALRYQPDRVELLRKLGQFSASQGFLVDARRYFLDYAQRQSASGKTDEALRALEDFANVVDDAEVRELLGQRLQAQGRQEDAIRELSRAYHLHSADRQPERAAGVLRAIGELDPASAALLEQGVALAGGTPTAAPPAGQQMERGEVHPADDLEMPASLSGADASEVDPQGVDRDPAERLEGYEPTALAAAETGVRTSPDGPDRGMVAPLEGLEPRSPESAGAADVEAEPDMVRDEASAGGDWLTEAPPADALEGLDGTGLPEGDLPWLLSHDDEPPLLAGRGADEIPALDGMDPAPAPEQAAAAGAELAAEGEEYVDLGALLAEETSTDTRFRVEEAEPTGDDERDFAELLSQFKARLSEHLPREDAAAHYDLGLAFKEMGLVDEAIAEFQVALRAGQMRLQVFEELGDCFLQKGQHNIAEKVLLRGLASGCQDELELLGVYYFLGLAYEGLDRPQEARDAYERVVGLDINFRDVSERLARL
jgi:tetratricopeptide (TPR) repeat protein